MEIGITEWHVIRANLFVFSGCKKVLIVLIALLWQLIPTYRISLKALTVNYIQPFIAGTENRLSAWPFIAWIPFHVTDVPQWISFAVPPLSPPPTHIHPFVINALHVSIGKETGDRLKSEKATTEEWTSNWNVRKELSFTKLKPNFVESFRNQSSKTTKQYAAKRNHCDWRIQWS